MRGGGSGGGAHVSVFSHAALPDDAEQADDAEGAAGTDGDDGDADKESGSGLEHKKGLVAT